MEREVLSRVDGGTKGLADALGGVASLISALKDAVLDIWKTCHTADAERREQVPALG